MNLTLLSSNDLIVSTETAVQHERKATSAVLDHLREIERRRLFAELGYASLFEYCVKSLKYCNASAQLRIDAMRLAREVPEVLEKLDSGEVSLSSVATLQQFFRAEKKSGKSYAPSEKLDLVTQVEGKSREETQRTLSEISPASVIPSERARVLTPTQTEIKFVADEKMMNLIAELKALMNTPSPSYAEVLTFALQLALGEKKLTPQRRAQNQVRRETSQATSPNEGTGQQKEKTAPSKARPYIPIATLRTVTRKTENGCAFVSAVTGRRCEARNGLQIEHAHPHAKGGTDDPENLTLLCPAHQRTRAIMEYGQEKMLKHLDAT